VLNVVQAAIDALQAKLDKKTRDADNGAQFLAEFSLSLVNF
jgi:hypothetical protein